MPFTLGSKNDKHLNMILIPIMIIINKKFSSLYPALDPGILCFDWSYFL